MQQLFQEARAIILFILSAFWHILPYLALSIPAAVYLKRSGIATKVEKALKGREWVAVVIATLAGAVSPFCSCGVVPIIAALLTGGLPLAPVMSFWLASPSMDPEIFFLSGGTLGWELAIWRLAATFAMSLAAGFITLWLERRGFIGGDILRRKKAAPTPTRSGSSSLRFAPAPLACCAAPVLTSGGQGGRAAKQCACGSAPAPTLVEAALPSDKAFCGCGKETTPPRDAEARRLDLAGIAKDSLEVLSRLALFMGLAFFLEAIIERYVPQGLIAASLGGSNAWAVPLATLIGIPFYTTELSALGIVSGLMKQGMSSAAALAFLIGGGVTTLPAMAAVWGVVKPRIFALYLAFCILGALFAGYALQLSASLR